ncbi:tetratricopeptide repeat-containing sensor histidine kinase [Flavobacterium sp. TMP13]|uniref:tetratricopeptide repeat-containing sensor histidine kinase n=1 Tax=Flavobacterium sp. TMP13 TaxID=3425950 RepID=UPI003D787CA9
MIFLVSCHEDKSTITIVDLSKKDASIFQKKAILQFQKNNFNNAFYYFNKSKISAEITQDSADVVYNLIQMASIQQINGDYYGSKETLTEALPYVKRKDIYSASINNYFGIADKELSIYEDAIFYYKEAIKDCKDETCKNPPLNNIAVVYIKQKKYDEAISILESLRNKQNIDIPSSAKRKGRVLDNLGYAYFKKGDSEKGFILINEGLEIRSQIDDFYGSIESNLHLAEYYQKLDIKKSNEYAKDAYEIATQFNSIDERLKALAFLISNRQQENNEQYAQKFIYLNDSIIKIRNNFKNKFAKIKYDSKKEKDENQKLRLEKAESLLILQKIKYQRFLFLSGIVFLIVLIALLIRYFKIKTKTERIKASYETETRIAKKIHDELANDVFHAITFTQTQSLTEVNTKENLIQKLDDIYQRVRGISRENNEILNSLEFSKNLKDLLATYNDHSRNIIINNIEKVDWELIDETKKVTLYRVLQELMVNMKKHSLASLIVVKFDNSDSKKLIVDYVDNGKGCNKAEIIKNGIQNMENRILSINGTIIFDTEPEKGFKAKIIIPNN